MIRWSRDLTADEYAAGLQAIAPRISDSQRRLLVEQHNALNRQVTAKSLAQLAEIAGGYTVVNNLYGRLGRMFCDATGHRPDTRSKGPNKGKERLWATWSTGWDGPDGFVWEMLPQVAEALEKLSWVKDEGHPLSIRFDWRVEVRNWCEDRRKLDREWIPSIEFLFQRAFDGASHPELAWFGVQKTSISLVVGGIYLAAIYRKQTVWNVSILIDKIFDDIEGLVCEPAKSTIDSTHPLTWADTTTLPCLRTLLGHDRFWASYSSASSKIHASPRIANARDEHQIRRGKRRLSDIFFGQAKLKSTMEQIHVAMEAQIRMRDHILIERRRDKAIVRRKKESTLARFGALRCEVCTFDFLEFYGYLGQKYAECHHLLMHSKLEENHLTTLDELAIVCANCHRMLHRPPYYRVEELREIVLRRRSDGTDLLPSLI